jgi:tripartite-type tricarboxylate transporter receptor subunit TctC
VATARGGWSTQDRSAGETRRFFFRLPKPVVDKLQQKIPKSLAQPDVRQKLLGRGPNPVGNTPEASAKSILAEIAKWAKPVKASGAKVD